MQGKAGRTRGSGGPGRSYREGISLLELYALFPDEAAAEQWFEEGR